MIIDQMREADRIEYLENLLNLERVTLESVTKQRDELQADLEFRRGLFQVQEQQLNEVRAERDEWKAKHIQQNKDLGCEMMDPSGTIWDFASGLQRENVQLKREVERERALANEAIATWRKTREERDKAREQRDSLAEAALAVVDRWKAPYWDEVGQYHYIDALRKAVEEVKGDRS